MIPGWIKPDSTSLTMDSTSDGWLIGLSGLLSDFQLLLCRSLLLSGLLSGDRLLLSCCLLSRGLLDCKGLMLSRLLSR